MFCSKCGREIEDKAAFCKYCGNRLVVPVGEEGKYNNSNKRARIEKEEKIRSIPNGMAITLAAVLIMVAVVATILYFVSREKKEYNGLNVNKLLAQYGITRVFMYEEIAGKDYLELMGDTLTIDDDCEVEESLLSYTGSYYLNDIVGEYTIGYVFHGSREEEEIVLEELSKKYIETKNNHTKRELRSIICWLKNDLSDEKIVKITDDGIGSRITEFNYDTDNKRLMGFSITTHNNMRDASYNVAYIYDDSGNISDITYDMDTEAEKNHLKYSYYYDKYCVREVVVKRDYSPSWSDDYSTSEIYAYGDNGEIKFLNYISFIYDKRGNLERITRDGQFDYKCQTDEYGNLVSMIDGYEDDYSSGYTFEFDEYNNIIRCTDFPDGEESYTWNYNNKGNLVKWSYCYNNDIISRSWEYDDEDNITKQSSKEEYEEDDDSEWWNSWDYELDDVGRIKRINTFDGNESRIVKEFWYSNEEDILPEESADRRIAQAYPQIRIEGEPLEESTEDTRDVSVSEQLEESDLRTIADNNGDLLAWTYEDFDGDGSFEAYALIAESKTGSFSGDIEKVIYIDSHGNTSFFYPEMKGFYTETEKSTYYECGGKGFFCAELTAGGSGWWTYMFSVKNGEPYELDLSCKIQGFYIEEDEFHTDSFYTTEDEYSDDMGHRYAKEKLLYDSDNQQFIKGERTNEYPLEDRY